MKLAFSIWVLMTPFLALQGQDVGAIGAPVLGFVFDSQARALRPVMGIPGASEIGTALEAGFSIALATVSPRQDYALVVTDGDRLVRLMRLGPASATGLPLDGIQPAPDRILLSPAGRSAALYYANSGLLQIVAGLPDTPSRVRKLDLSFLNGSVSSMAISDDGRLMLVESSDGLLVFQEDSAPRTVPVLGPISVLAFRAGSDDAVVAANGGSISLIQGLSRETTYRTLATDAAGLANAIATEFSADGSRVYAVSGDGGIGVFENSGAARLFSCKCQATGLFRMAGQTIFRLNDATTTPLWLLDASQIPERVWFVPANPVGAKARKRRPASER